MRKIDAAIIGGGAAGCIAAKELAGRGLDAVVFEEHAKPGKFGKCTGLVSVKGLKELGVDYSKAVVGKISGATIHSPNSSFSVRRKNVAVVLDRQAFDEKCAEEAAGAGAEIVTNSRVTGLGEAGKAIVLGKKDFYYSYIVGADGANSTTAHSLGFPPISKFVLCCEKEFESARVDDAELVEVFLDRTLFPGFFGWIVPAAGGARIGFGTTMHANARAAEKKFFAGKAARAAVGKKAPSREYWAVIPAALRGKTQMGNALLVGDAAGQVKASTGGGVVFGGMCAKIAAESIYESISRGAPLGYEAAWRGKYGTTLAAHSLVRSALGVLPNRALDLLVGGIDLGPRKLLERFGDMDFVLK